MADIVVWMRVSRPWLLIVSWGLAAGLVAAIAAANDWHPLVGTVALVAWATWAIREEHLLRRNERGTDDAADRHRLQISDRPRPTWHIAAAVAVGFTLSATLSVIFTQLGLPGESIGGLWVGWLYLLTRFWMFS